MDLSTRNALLELVSKLIQEKVDNPLANALFSELYLAIANEDKTLFPFLNDVNNAYEHQTFLSKIKEKLSNGVQLTDIEQNFVNEYPYEV